MTSALYLYVHTQAWGMSEARYSSGQKTADGVGNEEACAFPVDIAEDAVVRRLNQVSDPASGALWVVRVRASSSPSLQWRVY